MYLVDSVFWMDSTAMLRYINNEMTRFHTFVAKRVSEIQRGYLNRGMSAHIQILLAQSSSHSREAKHPAILSKDHQVLELLLQEVHKAVGHSGCNHVLSKLRLKTGFLLLVQ